MVAIAAAAASLVLPRAAFDAVVAALLDLETAQRAAAAADGGAGA